MIKGFFFALLSFILIAVGLSTASAHAVLIASNPSANSTILQLPKQITLTFGDPLLVFGKYAINSVQVTKLTGQRITSSTSVVKGEVLTNLFIVKKAIVGKFRVRFRVVAQDGHVVTGSFVFSVKNKIKR